mmetsp:Transcript_2776/g.5010  ORF Transcript_2776/g.5010 Transcript_2776/m.5010 type:complete len:218 (-) Transcript_2776:972-1625(-)
MSPTHPVHRRDRDASTSSFCAFRSCARTTSAATLDRNGGGSFVANPEALPAPHPLSVLSTSRNRTRFPSSFGAFPWTPPVAAPTEAGSRISLAVGAHSFARLHGMPNLELSPLIKMLDRPTNTRSWGKDLSSFTGEFGLSSPLSYPPGNSSTLASNSHMATAAAASSCASSFNSTPSSKARSPILRKSEGSESPLRSASAIMTLANVSRFRPEICLT